MNSRILAHLRESDHTPQYLSQHLDETSELAGIFAAEIGLEAAGEILGLLHDLGKSSQEFQDYLGSATGLIDPDSDAYLDYVAMKGKVDHSSAGAQYLYKRLISKGPGGKIAAQILSLCIASHHSGLIDCLSPDGENKFAQRMDKPEMYTHTNEAVESFIDQNIQKYEKYFSDSVVIDPLIKKIKSQREVNDDNGTFLFKIGLLIRFLLSCLIDADRLNTADFESPKKGKMRQFGQYVPWESMIKKLDIKIAEFDSLSENNPINSMRKSVSLACLQSSWLPQGIYQLKVPTGGGKTLASLRFALNHAAKYKLKRILYVIPFTSIIDQNANEVRKILEEKDTFGKYIGNIVLEHHSNLTPERETTRQGMLAENWDAPIIFTTQVQFLEALFGSGTRSVRRMHQLAQSIIIFDEVQTIPVRFVHMFNLALRFLVNDCHATVVLCTATQPLLDRVIPSQRALYLPKESQLVLEEQINQQPIKRCDIVDGRKPQGWSEEEVAQLACKELQNQGSVLLIVNTKKSARSLYQTLSKTDMGNVYHLSTNMCPVHRMEVLNAIRKKLDLREPVVCVSTQLIEAGVDIDFGCVIRYLAGFDSIIQAAGRCNRHGLREKGNVWIVNPAEENLDHLEDIRIGKTISERVLDDFIAVPESFDNDLLSEKVMNQYYEYYFFDRQTEMSYKIGKKSSLGREDDLFNLLSNNGISLESYVRTNGEPPDLPFKQSFQSASKVFNVIETFTRGIIVPFGEGGERLIIQLCGSLEIRSQFGLLKEAQRYSVNLFTYEFDEMVKKKAIQEVKPDSGIFYLASHYYSDDIGWCAEAVKPMTSLIC